jgi:pyruvate-formate lyase-activating enzyme
MTDTYCPLAWLGRDIAPTSIQPCCLWHGIGDPLDSGHDAGHSPVFVNTREKMLKGQKVNGCKQCYMTEEVGNKSRRQYAIEQYGFVNTVESKVLDISFDNLCNLKCRGCVSGNSHLWYSDEQEIYGQTLFTSKYVENNLKIDIENLEYIAISGGEPFLSKKFNLFAEDILSQNAEKNIFITVNTNGTTRPSSSVYNLLLNCKKLDLQVSIDGLGHLNSYFRSGADFKDCLDNISFYENLKKLRKEKETTLTIHTTVSIYNVNFLKEIEDYFKINYPEYCFNHRNLYWPAQLSIKHLPKDYKQLLIPIVEKFGESYKDVLFDLTTNDENYFDHFLNFHNTLDLLRNESLENSNPLLSEYIKNYLPTIKDSKTFFINQMNTLQCGT